MAKNTTKSNKPKGKTHHYRPIKRNPMVGGFDDVVDGTTSLAAWHGVAWLGDQAMGCCGCGGSGLCGHVGGW